MTAYRVSVAAVSSRAVFVVVETGRTVSSDPMPGIN